jgi:hypothetical protein
MQAHVLQTTHLIQPTTLSSLQVIYKKFHTPCPFIDFAFNSTASVIAVTNDTGYNQACVPKMVNLNSQVGSCTVNSISPSFPSQVFKKIFSMLLMTMEKTDDPLACLRYEQSHSVESQCINQTCVLQKE